MMFLPTRPPLRSAIIAVALSAAVVASACGSTAAAATVNGKDISRADFENELEALANNEQLQAAGGEALKGSGKETVSAELSAGWLTALIYDALITAEFDRRNLKVTQEDKDAAESQLATQFGSPAVANAFPDWFRKRLSERNARAVALRSAVSGVAITEAGIRKYYDEHKDEFAQACLSHILVETKEEADATRARILGGEDFAAVAKEVSKDPGSGQQGGDLDCNPRGAFVDEFDKAAFSLPLNEVSEPVQTQFGFHLLLVRERSMAPFEQARQQAKNALDNSTQGKFREFLDKAAREADVTVDSRYGTFEKPEGDNPRVIPPEQPSPPEGRPGEGGGTPESPFPETPVPGDQPAPEGQQPAPEGQQPAPEGQQPPASPSG